jgi:predicted secreted protein
MDVGRALGVTVLCAGLVVSVGCRRAEPPPAAPASQGEPLFKGLEPAPPVASPGGAGAATLPPATLPDGTVPGAMAMVTDLASGWPVTLQVGQSMSARLTADRAGGGRWSMRRGSDAGLLTIEGEPKPEEPPGGPAVEVFQIKAVKPGQTTLIFDLRKGSAAEPLRTVSYPITVQ